MSEANSAKWGVLLVNVGTPNAPNPPAIREFLGQFLMDPRVIDLPWVLRWPLVHGLIIPRRGKRTAGLYGKIWNAEGSPFLLFSTQFAEKLQQRLGADFKVVLGMRYGAPSLADAVHALKAAGLRKVVVFPLYPQYAEAVTLSSTEEFRRQALSQHWDVEAEFVPPFFDDPGFVDAYSARIGESLRDFEYDHLVFSFHGLPRRQVKKTEKSSHCFETYDCCEHIGVANRDCYRAQSFATARAIAWKLAIPAARYTVAFQSRIGGRWIEPFTDRVLVELANRGAKRVAVACPSFVADGLETLEEIQIRARGDFQEKGGEELRLVPSLNSDDRWVSAAAQLVESRVKR